jgi:DNA-binding SARP family transcriptional activator/tetratricopeptide (TPR) repeat protein
MRFRVLGPLEVRSGNTWEPISAGKWRTVLALLLINRDQVVSVGTLIDAVWGDKPPAKPANLISIYVLRLRRFLDDPKGQMLVTRYPGYLLRTRPGDIDAVRFEELITEGRRALAGDAPGQAATLLTEALGLWRGTVALADVPPSRTVDAEAERLGELRLDATELRIEADLRCGRRAPVVPELRALLSRNPMRERLWLLLMRALDGDGRRAEALEVFAHARETIADQLGVDPGTELRALHEQLLRADRDGASGRVVGSVTAGSVPASTEPPPGPSPSVPRPAQLPADIGDFTGREDLVVHLRSLLTERNAANSPGVVPVAVIAGSGGLGKTSLAVHAAHELAREFTDGQLYVDMLGATPHPQAPSDILARFLRDLGVESGHIPVGLDERSALYRTRLAGRRVLVLLDNARDAAQVRPLLPGSSSCGVMVTARSRMPDLASTDLVDLEVLDDEESRNLFAAIIGEKRVAAEPEPTADVLSACNGLPLAIRICAARLVARPGWSIRALSVRLADQRRRLDEMTAGDLAVRASFQVSLDSLPPPAGGIDPVELFGLLGLWPGPLIGLDAVAALADDTPQRVEEALETLVDACLLESPAPGQYRFHDLLRVYAAERARDPPAQGLAALRRVLEWYLYTVAAAADRISPHRTRIGLAPVPDGCRPLGFANLDDALAWCETERPNIVAATQQAATGSLDDIAWRLPAAAMPFFNRRGYRADWIRTHEIGLEAARRLGYHQGEAAVLANLGIVLGDSDPQDAIDTLTAAIDAARAAEDLPREAHAAVNLADVRLKAGLFAEVIEMHEDLLANLRRLGRRYYEGVILTTVGEAHLGLGEVGKATGFFRLARELFREIDERRGESIALQHQGEAFLELGQLDEGIECLDNAVRVARAAGERVVEAAALKRLGRAYGNAEQMRLGQEALTRARDLFSALGDVAMVTEVDTELSKYR